MFATSTTIYLNQEKTSYIIAKFTSPERDDCVIMDDLGRTNKDLQFLKLFKRILFAAGRGDLKTCQCITEQGFRDFNAIQVEKSGSISITPLEAAESKGHVEIARYFRGVMDKSIPLPERLRFEIAGVFKAIVCNSSFVFCEKPDNLDIHQDYIISRNRYTQLREFGEILKDKGPLVACGKFAPSTRIEKHVPKNVAGFDVFKWRDEDNPHEDNPQQVSVIILGAGSMEVKQHGKLKRTKQKEGILFARTQQLIVEGASLPLKHQPSTADSRIYFMRYEKFTNYLSALYPPLISEEAYYHQLYSEPLESVQDDTAVQEKYRSIWSRILEEGQAKAGGNEIAGILAVQNMRLKILSTEPDGPERLVGIDSTLPEKYSLTCQAIYKKEKAKRDKRVVDGLAWPVCRGDMQKQVSAQDS